MFLLLCANNHSQPEKFPVHSRPEIAFQVFEICKTDTSTIVHRNKFHWGVSVKFTQTILCSNFLYPSYIVLFSIKCTLQISVFDSAPLYFPWKLLFCMKVPRS